MRGRGAIMKEKKIPQRMCIACKEMKNKKELIRIVRSPEGEISLDFTGKKNGRGAYICPMDECITKCVKSKLINKTFKCDAGAEVYEKITDEFKSGKR